MLTVIGKERYDSHVADLEHRRYDINDRTVRYSSGPDSEEGKHAGDSQKV